MDRGGKTKRFDHLGKTKDLRATLQAAETWFLYQGTTFSRATNDWQHVGLQPLRHSFRTGSFSAACYTGYSARSGDQTDMAAARRIRPSRVRPVRPLDSAVFDN